MWQSNVSTQGKNAPFFCQYVQPSVAKLDVLVKRINTTNHPTMSNPNYRHMYCNRLRLFVMMLPANCPIHHLHMHTSS